VGLAGARCITNTGYLPRGDKGHKTFKTLEIGLAVGGGGWKEELEMKREGENGEGLKKGAEEEWDYERIRM